MSGVQAHLADEQRKPNALRRIGSEVAEDKFDIVARNHILSQLLQFCLAALEGTERLGILPELGLEDGFGPTSPRSPNYVCSPKTTPGSRVSKKGENKPSL